MKATEVNVRITGIDLTDRFEGVVHFETQSGKSYDAYFWGADFTIGDERIIELAELSSGFSWEATFSLNAKREKKLKKGSKSGEYVGYGQIEGINPVIANFGDFKLNLGDWTNDKRIIGEYIYWPISRLEVVSEVLENK